MSLKSYVLRAIYLGEQGVVDMPRFAMTSSGLGGTLRMSKFFSPLLFLKGLRKSTEVYLDSI